MFGCVFSEPCFSVDANEAYAETLTVAGNSNVSSKRLASRYVIRVYLLGFFPPLPIRMLLPRFRMVNVFAPILVKLLVMELLMPSIEVRIPTSAVMPMAMISIVRMARSHWLRIESKATFTFSLNSCRYFLSMLFFASCKVAFCRYKFQAKMSPKYLDYGSPID
jgi:hypothetical protein